MSESTDPRHYECELRGITITGVVMPVQTQFVPGYEVVACIGGECYTFPMYQISVPPNPYYYVPHVRRLDGEEIVVKEKGFAVSRSAPLAFEHTLELLMDYHNSSKQGR